MRVSQDAFEIYAYTLIAIIIVYLVGSIGTTIRDEIRLWRERH